MSIFRDGILEGQVALVTGGGSGGGMAVARRFAEQGARVGLLGRRIEKLDAAWPGEIASAGGEALALAADVRDYDAVADAIAKLVERFGGLDILVNSAAGNFISSRRRAELERVQGGDRYQSGRHVQCYARRLEHLSKRGG